MAWATEVGKIDSYIQTIWPITKVIAFQIKLKLRLENLIHAPLMQNVLGQCPFSFNGDKKK